MRRPKRCARRRLINERNEKEDTQINWCPKCSDLSKGKDKRKEERDKEMQLLDIKLHKLSVSG